MKNHSRFFRLAVLATFSLSVTALFNSCGNYEVKSGTDDNSNLTKENLPLASFSALRDLLNSKVDSQTINGYAMQVFDRNDALLFQSDYGTCNSSENACPPGNPEYKVDTITGVASSSKWVTSTTLLAAVDDLVNQKKIDSVASAFKATVGQVLRSGCSEAPIGRGSTIALMHVLSFTRGLLPEHECISNRSGSMISCACEILADSAKVEANSPTEGPPSRNAHPPGTTYKYGSTHQFVAAVMLEKATGESYQELYSKSLAQPLGLTALYKNPKLVSGSLQSSVSEW